MYVYVPLEGQLKKAQVAQSVQRKAENLKVVCSSSPVGTIFYFVFCRL